MAFMEQAVVFLFNFVFLRVYLVSWLDGCMVYWS